MVGGGSGLTIGEVRILPGRGLGGGGKKDAGLDVGLQQFLHLGEERCVAPAGAVKVAGALGALGPVEGPEEQGLQVGLRRCHRSSLRDSSDGGSGPASIPTKRYAPSGAKVRQGFSVRVDFLGRVEPVGELALRRAWARRLVRGMRRLKRRLAARAAGTARRGRRPSHARRCGGPRPGPRPPRRARVRRRAAA